VGAAGGSLCSAVTFGKGELDLAGAAKKILALWRVGVEPQKMVITRKN
jgi:hypothetical protein